LAVCREGLPLDLVGTANAQALIQQHWATALVPQEAHAPLPFVFVEAINLELSYSCNLACSHCLQEPLRPKGASTWLDPSIVAPLLKQAHTLQLLRRGLNLTGGEVVAAGSPVLELLALAQAHGIPTRINTNAWWGLQQQIRVGDQVVADDAGLVEALRQRGLGRLALSLDDRFRQYPQLLERVIRVATLCQAAGLACEFVATDADPELLELVEQRCPVALITPMEVVDVGGAQSSYPRALRIASLAALAQLSGCATAGFHRPTLLHVAPDGGLRCCLMAPGSGWLGNLHKQSLVEILNAAATNPVLQLFANGNLEAFVAKHLAAWQHLYRGIDHGCTAAALIARLAELLSQQQQALGRELQPQEQESLHRQLAAEMGLTSIPPAGTPAAAGRPPSR
jgi:organic radical activating enzyme